MDRYIDESYNYCPQCNEEYRADIPRCAECDTALISGKQLLLIQKNLKDSKACRNMSISTADDLVDARKGSVIEIKQNQIMLEKHGIPSLIASDNNCGKGCCGPNVILQIRKSDIEEVMSLFSIEHEKTTALREHDTTYADSVISDEEGDTTCPACGFSFSIQTAECPDCGLYFA